MKVANIRDVQRNLDAYLRLAEEEEIIIVKDDQPVGVLIGLADHDAWHDYLLESDPRFLKRIREARRSIQEGRGVYLEEIEALMSDVPGNDKKGVGRE